MISLHQDTSAAAMPAASDAAKLRERCLAILKSREATADEVAEIMGKSVLSIRPRISQLAAAGLIYDTGRRGKNNSGHSAIIWAAKTDFKLEA